MAAWTFCKVCSGLSLGGPAVGRTGGPPFGADQQVGTATRGSFADFDTTSVEVGETVGFPTISVDTTNAHLKGETAELDTNALNWEGDSLRH